jgi:hypothetical protein
MTETLTARQASFELAEDHRRLHGMVGRLAAAADAPALAEALAELHAAMTRHFTEEEKPGGLYDALGVCAPEFRARLGALVDDHYRIAGMIRDLAERARGAQPSALPALRADGEHLAAALVDHERREHEMVEAATGRV